MIRLENLSKYYPSSRRWALREVSLEVDAGRLLVITGPSGSGKTTLLNMISGLDRPSDGRVLVGEHCLTKMGDRALSEFRNRRIGFIFQTFYLNPHWSLVDNVALPLMLGGFSRVRRRARAVEVLERLGLADVAEQKASTLSGGQKQRAVIGRAIVHRPAVILADEPVANLDPELAAGVLAMLRELADEGAIVLVVQHQLEHTEFADRAIRIREGRLRE